MRGVERRQFAAGPAWRRPRGLRFLAERSALLRLTAARWAAVLALALRRQELVLWALVLQAVAVLVQGLPVLQPLSWVAQQVVALVPVSPSGLARQRLSAVVSVPLFWFPRRQVWQRLWLAARAA